MKGAIGFSHYAILTKDEQLSINTVLKVFSGKGQIIYNPPNAVTLNPQLIGKQSMNTLKKVFFIFVALILAIVAYGFTLPDNTKVSRSISLNVANKTLFDIVNNIKQFNNWSPWARIDPDTEYTFAGPETGVGAKMSWKSAHADVGVGSQEIVEIVSPSLVILKLEFEGQGGATAFYKIEDTSNDGKISSKMTWGFETEHGSNIVSRYFGLMMDKWVGTAYENGLQNLKELVEDDA